MGISDKKKIDNSKLDSIAGGILQGTYDGVKYSATFNKTDGTYNCTIDGKDYVLSEKDAKAALTEYFGADNTSRMLKEIQSADTHTYESKTE